MRKKLETLVVALSIIFLITTLAVKQEQINRLKLIQKEVSRLKLEVYTNDLEIEKKERELILLRQLEDKELILYGECTLTAYTLDQEECEKPITSRGYGITAIGKKAVVGVTVAADWDKLPPGTEIFIEGVGIRKIQDRGGAIKGDRIDLFYGDPQEDSRAKKEALIFGKQERKVWIVKSGGV